MTFHPISGVRPAATSAGGAYGWLTPHIAALAAHNEDIRARALNLTRGELHFIALVIALMGEKASDANHVAAFARMLGARTRKDILAAFAPGSDPALARLAAKLAGGVWRAPQYARLAALYGETHARKTLNHLPSVTRRHVAVLARLPAAYRTRGVLKMMRRPRALSEVVLAIEVVRRVRTDLTDRQILASLEKGTSANIQNWVMRHYQHAPFPAAPTPALIIDGVDALRPLTCYADLARGAVEFDNCIRSDLWRVLKGDTYFYRYAPQAGGKGVAIVELKRAPVIGWVVHEALGPGNGEVNGVHRAAILSAFREAGIGAVPQAANPQAWFYID